MSEVLAASDAARLTEFSRAFKAAARAVVLYPGAHPAIIATLGRLTHLTSSAQLTAPLRISVTADSLLMGGRGIARPDAAIAELARLLHAHLIGEITIHADGDEAGWRAFLLLIGRAPDVVRAEGGVARLWTTMAARHVEVREIDYAEVLRERQIGVGASWQQIVANCLAGDTVEIPEALLQALIDGTMGSEGLNEVVAQFEDAALPGGPGLTTRTAALVRLLRGIVRAVAGRAPERTEPVMCNLAVALGGLSADMMLSLMAQGREDVAAAPVVGPLVSRIPDSTIAGFVARHALAPGTAIERVAQAFQALVVDDGRRERLVAMAHESAAQQVAAGEEFERRWQDVAEKLLTQYSDEGYVSAEYARELGTARAQAIQLEQLFDDPPERLAAWLGTVATSQLRRLDLTLMLDLMRLEQDADRRERLMSPVLALLDDLFLVGDFEAADAVVRALRTDAVEGTGARAVLARATLARAVTGPTMRQIVGHLGTIDDGQFQRAKTVCLSLGETIVRPLAEALASEERTRTRERLTEVLLGFGAIGRREVEQLKSSANPAVRRTAVYLLREFGGSEALPELTELLDDTEAGVQREAVRAILKIGTDRGYRVLQQALAGGTSRSREAIMLALGSNREERSAPLLVYILEHVPHTGGLGWVYAKALDLLGQVRDPDSVPALRTALYRGEWWAPRRTASLRSAAAAALARIGTTEATEVLADAAQNGPRGVRAAARAHLETAGGARSDGGRR